MKYKRDTRKRKFKRRKTRVNKAKLITRLLLLLGILAIIIGILCSKCSSDSEEKESPEFQFTFVTDSVAFNGKYGDTFKDLQDVQIVVAESYGIAPLASTDSIEEYLNQGMLQSISTCDDYECEEASLPYLIPEAKALLDEIARRYQNYEKAHKQLRITSCLRTDESIAKLMRGNKNSIKNSCHLYGTTFDISYRYLTPQEKRSVAQALYELQQAGYCYVKYERKQPCFHTTVIASKLHSGISEKVSDENNDKK